MTQTSAPGPAANPPSSLRRGDTPAQSADCTHYWRVASLAVHGVFPAKCAKCEEERDFPVWDGEEFSKPKGGKWTPKPSEQKVIDYVLAAGRWVRVAEIARQLEQDPLAVGWALRRAARAGLVVRDNAVAGTAARWSAP